MKLISVSLLSVLFILSLADTKPCTGSRCKRMSNVVAQLYNDYDYGYGEGYGDGYNNYQNSIGNSCERLSPSYPEYDDNDGVFHSQENTQNSKSSNDHYYNYEDPEQEDIFSLQPPLSYEQQHQQLKHRPNHQRPRKNYQQRVGSNTSGQSYHPSNQQPSNPPTPIDDNQETEYTPNPGRNHQGKFESGNQGGNGGQYEVGSNGRYPGSGNQGGGGGRHQNNGDGYNGYYPDSGNQGGGGGRHQNNGDGYNGYYPDSKSSCPNCYATDFGNGDNNKNVINIEK